jgi:hypothetical protein
MSRLPKRPILQIKNRGGAPKGNRNALKTGMHTKERRAWRAEVRGVLLRAKLVLAQVDD